MKQSIKIISQCINMIPNGLIKTNNTKMCPPTKIELKQSMESIIHHFKIYTNGFNISSNETYVATEAPKGEFLRRRDNYNVHLLNNDVYFYIFFLFVSFTII